MVVNKDELTFEGIASMGYGMIYKMPMKDLRLSVESKAIYAYMCSYGGGGKNEAFPSIELMCKDLKMSERRLRKYRDELVELGYIEIQKMKVEGKNYKKNKYIIKQSIDKSIPLQSVPLQNDMVSNRNGAELIRCQNNSDINNSSLNNNSNNNNNILKDNSIPSEMHQIKNIFDHYISKNIIKHEKLTANIINAVKTRLKDYPYEVLMQVINNYAIVFHSDKYYFTQRYSLINLMREKDVIQFSDSAFPLTNFLTNKNQYGGNNYGRNQQSNKPSSGSEYSGLSIG